MNIYPEIVIDSTPNSYQRNADLLGMLIAGETGNPNFTDPNPSVVDLTAVQTLLLAAITAYGPKGNRKGREALLDLRQKSAAGLELIKAAVDDITRTATVAAAGDTNLLASILATSTLPVRTFRVPQGVLGQVRDIHQVDNPGLNRNQVEWGWRRPLGVTSRNNVKINKVFRATTADFGTAELIATPSKSKFIDANLTGATITYFYWFCAVTAAGDGALSALVSITLLPA